MSSELGRRRFVATAAATIAGLEFSMLGATKSPIEFLDPGVEAFCFTSG
jgi:hypothetical protein